MYSRLQQTPAVPAFQANGNKLEPPMKQFDVDLSPPANIITFRLGLTHVTFDL